MGLCPSKKKQRKKKGKIPSPSPEQYQEYDPLLDDPNQYEENNNDQGYGDEPYYDDYVPEHPSATPQNDWQEEERYSPGYSPNNLLSPERDMNGYPPENYSHQQPLAKPGSFLSSNSSNNLTNGTNSNGNRSPRRGKRPRKRPKPNPANDFNGLLSTDDEDFGNKKPAPQKQLRRSNFKPKKGQVWLWTVKDVRHWIQNLGDAYREYAADFADNAIDGQLLLRMDNNDYHELGVVSALHVKKIQVELDRLVQESSKHKTHVPRAVLSIRSDMSDSTISKKKKKKKRPKKQAIMAFPSQYSMMNPYNAYPPPVSRPVHSPQMRWVPTQNPSSSPYGALNMHPHMSPPGVHHFGPPHGGMNYRLCTVYE